MQPPPYDQAVAGPSKPPRKVRRVCVVCVCVFWFDLLRNGLAEEFGGSWMGLPPATRLVGRRNGPTDRSAEVLGFNDVL